MINKQIIYKIIGSLLFIEAALMILCLLVSIYYQEDDIMSFLISIISTFLLAFILRFMGRNADNSMSKRDAYLVVTLSWAIFSAMGTLPFLCGGYINNFTDAYFETMSGFTTTGATIIDDVERLPHGIIFWRSLTQWIGGLGIVFFTIALLPSLVGGSVRIFAAEATGPIKSKLHPKLSTSAKAIWAVYITLSVACVLTYYLLGMGWYDSVNYAMTSLATGGFSTHNESVLFFHSPSLEYATTFFCFVSGMNFTLLYFSVIEFKIKKLLKSSEFRLYLSLVLMFTAFIMMMLIFRNNYDIERAFRVAIFQVVSFITTTGLFSDDAATWPHVTWVVLAVCMFIGACSGSTSGGFKCIRAVMLLKIVRNEFKQILHPNAVLPLKIDGTNIPTSKRVTLLAFLTVNLIMCLVCAFSMIAAGIDNTNAITITLSSLGNVGPTLGIEIGPTMSWSMLPDFAKWECSVLMLMGRLEIFTVLVLFTREFWKDN
ncbi:MAG: TrkH family potassium uptake protein [Prevotella sp.]|nr:TrkH family potassium uptake protein [Prevotella sp.]MDD7461506.1 TrkH family potassium uptake protein [Prevotellaceae bacterium]MDY3365081.1 TrkH family potassium uptake protein [Prevotella sp.]MDY3853079.1 TrkH family potassium uptake protein [Prevotella sp.]